MAWVVDTCLLLDVALADAAFVDSTRSLLKSRQAEGLVVCPVVFIELSPVFQGDRNKQAEFLYHLGVSTIEAWTPADTYLAHEAWGKYMQARRSTGAPRRPVADALIGAFASRFDGLLTRNESDFRKLFPYLRIVSS